jgi:hypothetical protein
MDFNVNMEEDKDKNKQGYGIEDYQAEVLIY